MKRIIEKLKVENKIVSLYNDLSETGSCWTGWICDVDDNHVLLAHISENGFYGGFTLIELDSIFNIEADTKYEQKIHKLYLLKKQKHPLIHLEQTQTLFDETLEYAFKNNLFISCEFGSYDDYSPTGLIAEISEEFLTLHCYNNYGHEDGFSYFKKEDIKQIYIDSLHEQNTALLYKANLKQ